MLEVRVQSWRAVEEIFARSLYAGVGATENFVVSWCGKAASALLQGRGALATSPAPKSLTTDPCALTPDPSPLSNSNSELQLSP